MKIKNIMSKVILEKWKGREIISATVYPTKAKAEVERKKYLMSYNLPERVKNDISAYIKKVAKKTK